VKYPEVRRNAPIQEWNIIAVSDRLVEGYRVLARLPMRVWPKEFGSCMPAYTHEYTDHLAQIETGEFEKLLDERNRVRVRPSSIEIARAEQALAWPARYLRHPSEMKPSVTARAVCLCSMWEALELDRGRQCKRLGLAPKWLAECHETGLVAITGG
jgi:hypothetical protein